MKTTPVEKIPVLWWKTLWESYSRKLTSPDNVSEKISWEEQCPLIRRKVVWRNYSEQLTEKQYIFENCTKSPKKETPRIFGNRCSFDQKRIACPCKEVVNRLEIFESSKLLPWKIIRQKSFSTKATRFFLLPTYPTTSEVSHQYVPTIRIQCSTLSKLNYYFFAGRDVQLQ